MQQLFWDDSIDSLNVMHEINFENNVNARPGLKRQFKPGDPEYKAKCLEYELEVKKNIIITEYEYDEYEEHRDYRLLVTFPAIESFFLLAGLPHFVAVSLNKLEGNVSKTTGEALPGN